MYKSEFVQNYLKMSVGNTICAGFLWQGSEYIFSECEPVISLTNWNQWLTNCVFDRHLWEILHKFWFVQKFSEILKTSTFCGHFTKILHRFCLLQKFFLLQKFCGNSVVNFPAQILQDADYRNSAEFSHFFFTWGVKIKNRFLQKSL